MKSHSQKLKPDWPSIIALLVAGSLRWALPRHISIGPPWLSLVVLVPLLVPTLMARRRGNYRLNQILGHLLIAIITLDMASSLYLLISALPSHTDSPQTLLTSAAALWVTNTVVFASWYWRLDAGGPLAREVRESHTAGAFLFPQMTLNEDARKKLGQERWTPNFVDYLFLAFNTSTAFSPTDVPVLSRWAKVLTMIQALVSLTTVALAAARAVNIL
jgi:hypothetical protein